MNWIQIDSEQKLDEVISLSKLKRVLIFMFNMNTTVSYLIKYTLEREWNPREMEMPAYIIDPELHNYIAAELANNYGVTIYSPQAFVIEKGKSIFSAVDGEVDFKTLRNYANCKN